MVDDQILVIDDSKATRRVIASYLAPDHHVDTACSVEEGLELLEQGTYGLIISDVVMPGQSGIDLLRTCKSQYVDTEIVLITGRPRISDAVMAMRIGVFDYLEKGAITRENLRGVVSAALARRAAQRSVPQVGQSTLVMGVEVPPQDIAEGYHTVRRLGAGANGIVLLVEQGGVSYAMKIFRSSGSPKDDELRRLMLLREAKALSRLEHRGVVRICDSGTTGEGGVPFIVMEYVDGCSLRRLMDEQVLGFRQRIDILHQVAEGLAEIHRNGIVHRDIKPENVLVTETLCAKIADFGISYVSDATMSLTDTHTAGTPSYMAPESFTVGCVDHVGDVFSLGVLSYELLAEKKPFCGATIPQVIDAVKSDVPADMRALPPESSEKLRQIVARMLDKNPNTRYHSCARIARELAQISLVSDGKSDCG